MPNFRETDMTTNRDTHRLTFEAMHRDREMAAARAWDKFVAARLPHDQPDANREWRDPAGFWHVAFMVFPHAVV